MVQPLSALSRATPGGCPSIPPSIHLRRAPPAIISNFRRGRLAMPHDSWRSILDLYATRLRNQSGDRSARNLQAAFPTSPACGCPICCNTSQRPSWSCLEALLPPPSECHLRVDRRNLTCAGTCGKSPSTLSRLPDRPSTFRRTFSSFPFPPSARWLRQKGAEAGSPICLFGCGAFPVLSNKYLAVVGRSV